MSGQCFGCGTEFGVFKKEHGCKNCGFAFCSKCLNEKSIPVPKKNNAKHRVCHKCFNILTGAVPQSTEEHKYDLPEAYIKRVTALLEKEKGGNSCHSGHIPGGGNAIPEHMRRLDNADREIAMRLEKLRADDRPEVTALLEREKGGNSSHSGHIPGVGKAIPEHMRRLDNADREIAMRLEKLRADDRPKEKVTDADLQSRLANLKGQQFVPEQKPVYKPPERRPETQQVDDLIEQLIAEVDLDSMRPGPVQEVEDRLARFRQADGTKSAIDNINLNQLNKGVQEVNDLNKVDKMGWMGRGYSQDDRNIHMEKGASAAAEDEMDLEEIGRLMSQAATEIELDAQRVMKGLQQDKMLMDKLKELQKHKADQTSADWDAVDSDADNTVQTVGAAGVTMEISDEDEDDEVSARNIVQQCLDEVKIDAAVGRADEPVQLSNKQRHKRKKLRHKENSASASVELKPSNLEPPCREDLVDSDYDDADELPYCCICTEDATVRCRDCDQDLYCQRCFKGCHDEMEIRDHRVLPYRPPKGYR